MTCVPLKQLIIYSRTSSHHCQYLSYPAPDLILDMVRQNT